MLNKYSRFVEHLEEGFCVRISDINKDDFPELILELNGVGIYVVYDETKVFIERKFN